VNPIVPIALLIAAGAATPAFAATATQADRAFVAKVSQGGMFEVKAGRLAAQKASAQDVRDFGAMEAHDHTLVGDKLKAISTSEGVALAPRLNAEFQGKLDHLMTLSGKAFDDAYMKEMSTLHAGDGAAFAKESSDGGSQAYRAFGAETHLIVQRHIGAIHAAPPVG
jgi:putative membrane protein